MIAAPVGGGTSFFTAMATRSLHARGAGAPGDDSRMSEAGRRSARSRGTAPPGISSQCAPAHR
jgi:hypothetical protein